MGHRSNNASSSSLSGSSLEAATAHHKGTSILGRCGEVGVSLSHQGHLFYLGQDTSFLNQLDIDGFDRTFRRCLKKFDVSLFFPKFGRCLKIRIVFFGIWEEDPPHPGLLSPPLSKRRSLSSVSRAFRMDEFAYKKARWMMAIPRKAANVRTKWKFIAGKIIYKWWM